jgi:3-methyladenine DNA glycosylase/8-oxoguanine DNA glycosylase
VTPVGELELVGRGGEPVDLRRTIQSHGLVDLPPFRPDEDGRALEATLRVAPREARTIRISEAEPGLARIEVAGPRLTTAARAGALETARHVLRLDDDLSGFYARAVDDPDLAWATRGAGRLVRSQTVFEDVVKTICTTNCAWSATERMVGALVQHLGDSAPGAPDDSARGRTFPTPQAMAGAPLDFYRDVVRAGYRGAYLRQLSQSVAAGELDLELLGTAPPVELPDEEIETRLLALPGVGPYAAAHIMMMLGRYSKLILDSWTRPKYAAVTGRKAKDSTIERRFRHYGPYAGLAFWLVLTRDWIEDEETVPPAIA